MKYLILVLMLALVGCHPTLEHWTPEEQGAMIKRCEANGLGYSIGDWGRIYCDKKEK